MDPELRYSLMAYQDHISTLVSFPNFLGKKGWYSILFAYNSPVVLKSPPSSYFELSFKLSVISISPWVKVV